MPELHLICGGKGGVGKTLCALCASLTYLSRAEQVLIIDLNYHNADLSELLGPLTVGEDSPLGETGFSIAPMRPSFDGESIAQSYLIYPTPGGRVFGRLPWEAGLGIYRHLESILQRIAYGVGVAENYSPEFCIVDTGFHLSNLNPQPPRAVEHGRKVISKELLHLTAFTPHIWFIWTIAMLNRPNEYEAARAALRELAAVQIDEHPWFKERNNLIQVVNPHVLAPPQKLFSFFPEDDVKIKALEDLLDAPPISPMPLGPFYAKVGAAVTAYGGDLRDKYFEEIAEAIGLQAQTGSLYRRSDEWTRPTNVFPIPFYKRSLAGYTDAFEQKDRYGLKDLQDALGDIYPAIRRCLQNYGVYG